MKIAEFNCQTGEEITRDATVTEVAQAQADLELAQAEASARAQAEAEAQAKREAALSKLAALGLTADDLKALGL